MRFTLLLSILLAGNILFAQIQHHIPHRKGDLWGYADTTGKLMVKHKYTKVFTYNKYNRYLVKKDSKYGIVNSEGKVIIPVKYKNINRNKKAGYIASNTNEYYFYNSKGILITKKPYKDMYYGRNDYVYFITDSLKCKYNIKENKIVEITKISDDEYGFEFDEEEFIDMEIIWNTKEYRKVILGDKQGICKYTRTEKGIKKNKQIIEQLDTLDFRFNEVMIFNYYKLKFAIFRDNQKWGVVYNDSIQVEAVYDEISTNLINRNCKDFYFIAKKSGRYGVIDLTGKTMVNFEHDEILFPTTSSKNSMTCFNLKNGILVKNNDKFGLISIGNKLLLDCKFDTIEYSTYRFYVYTSGNKKGVYSSEFKTELVIDSTERLGSITSIDKHKLLKVKYADGKLKGYINQNGVIFYKD